MKRDRETLYWDACIFLAWLQNEQLDPGVMEGIEEHAKRVTNNQAILVTSIMTRTEVLDSRLSKAAKDQFTNLFKRRNVEWINHDERVSTLSHDIRDHYDQQGVKLSSADCVHLASGILYDVDVFYTLDGSGKKKKGKLLPLNGNVAGHKLRIEKPYQKQLSLNLQPPGQSADESGPHPAAKQGARARKIAFEEDV